MTTEVPEEVCGTVYAAKLLGLSVGTVQSLVEKNELQAWRTRGGHRRISLQSIRDYQRVHGLPSDGDKDALMRVLVVDDDAASLEVFRKTMAAWNLPLDCTTVSSALEAIIDIGSLKPDVLITDLRMPGVDGFELLRTLNGSPNYASLLVIGFSCLSS
jgi:excisionase family DNA binding protein